jgi:hypothetical protein
LTRSNGRRPWVSPVPFFRRDANVSHRARFPEPQARGEVETDRLDEASVEQDGAKTLIAEIEAVTPS